MKRISAFIMVLCLISGLCACGKKSGNDYKFDVAALASEGKMTESKFNLGTDPGVIKNAYSDTDNSAEESFTESEGASTKKLSIDNFDYHYYKEYADNGISVIVNFGDAYGFENGLAMSKDVVDAVKGKYTLAAATEDQMYFLRGAADNCEVLSYTFGDYRLDFYFIDYFLSATTLTDTRYWK